MGALRRGRISSLGLALVLAAALQAFSSSVAAQSYYERPVLALDPDMHTAKIWQVDVSADGRLAASGGEDKTLRLWETKTGRLLRTIRMHRGPGKIGVLYSTAVSPDAELVAVAGRLSEGPEDAEQVILVLSAEDGRLVRRLQHLPATISTLRWSPDGRWLAVMLTEEEGLRVFDTVNNWALAAIDQDYADTTTWAAWSPDSGLLATSSYDGHVRVYTAPTFERQAILKTTLASRPADIAFNKDGSLLAISYENAPAVSVHDARTLEFVFQPDNAGIDNGNLSKVEFSLVDDSLYAAGRYHDEADQRRLVRWMDQGRGERTEVQVARHTISSFVVLPDGSVLLSAADPRLVMVDDEGKIRWDTGTILADFRGHDKRLRVNADGTSVGFSYVRGFKAPARFDVPGLRLVTEEPPMDDLATPIMEGLAVEGWNDTETPTIDGAPLPLDNYETARGLAIHPDGTRFALAGELSVRMFDSSGKQLWRLEPPGDTRAVNIPADGRFVVAVHDDGTIRWYRVEDGQELLAVFPHGDRERWIAWTPAGYFAASPGAEDLVGWHLNGAEPIRNGWYTVERFREAFHRPDIIREVLLAGDPEEARKAANETAGMADAPISIESLLPPRIELLAPWGGETLSEETVEIRYQLFAGVTERVDTVEVRFNNKVLKTHEIGRELSDEGVRERLRVQVPPRDGVLSLIAYAGRQASDPASADVTWGGEPDQEQRKPDLYVLAVGVADYREHDDLDLRFADDDAEGFTSALLDQEATDASIYKSIKPYLLQDAEATWRHFFEVTQDLERHMRDDDVVMLLFSGHGYRARGEYYLLPHDVNKQDAISVQRTAIYYDQVRKWLRNLARKGQVFVFLDACRSGSASEDTLDSLPDVDRIATDLAAPENGVVVVTSSLGNQLSIEHEAWQNGAFTEALIEAFTGHADPGQDGALSVGELFGYIEKRVGILTAGAQTPTIRVPHDQALEQKIANASL